MPFHRIGSLDDFPDGRGVAVNAGGRRLAVFRIGADVFVIDDNCPHRNFPLHDGIVTGCSVRCRTHGSGCDLASGAVTCGPARRGVRTYRTQVVGDAVEVEI